MQNLAIAVKQFIAQRRYLLGGSENSNSQRRLLIVMNKEGFLWLQEMLRGAQHDGMSCLVYGFSYTSGLTILGEYAFRSDFAFASF